jgi:hypothetical protein
MTNKETLEEAAERIYQEDFNNPYLEEIRRKNIKDAMIKLAKWQSERLYSEKDLRTAYFSGIKTTGEGWNGEYAGNNDPNVEETFEEGYQKWFEQFKKK